LPDIEEINSTLRPDMEAVEAPEAEEPDARAGRGFRLGFAVTAALVAAAVSVYFLAAPLSEAVQPLEAPIASYVATVDALRVALETQVERLLTVLPAEGAAG
jgi:hypothetical protein